MKLNIMDRLVIPAILLPKKNSIIENTISDSIAEMLRFTPVEVAKYNLMGNYNAEELSAAEGDEYSFTAEQLQIIRNSIKELDAGKAIPREANKTCLKILNND